MATTHVCTECYNITKRENMLHKEHMYICKQCHYKDNKCEGCNKHFQVDLHPIGDVDSTILLCDGCYLKYYNLPLDPVKLN